MNETDLRSLALDTPGRLAAPCRPVDQIIARGTTLRRRRRALRAVGPTTLAAALVAAVGSLGAGDRPDVRSDNAEPSPATQPSSPSPAGFLPPPGTCSNDDETPLTAEQVDPALLVLPGWLPPGFTLLDASATRYDPCSFGRPVLVLADFEGETMTGTVTVTGPYAEPLSASGEPTPLRGTTGTRWEGTRDTAGLHLEWTEPGGGWWTVNGRGVDETSLRAVVESLVLSTIPGSPPATLPSDAAPGYEVLWQAPHVPALDQAAAVEEWTVIVGAEPRGGSDATPTCSVGYSRDEVGVPPVARQATPGVVRTEVSGQVAAWDLETSTLVWGDGGDAVVTGTVACTTSVDLATAQRIAESLEAAQPDDPRLDALPTLDGVAR